MKSSIERFAEIAAEPRFRGWPLVGEIEYGPKIQFFGEAIHYRLETGNGIEEYWSLLRHFGWVVVFGVAPENMVPTLVQWKPGVNRASWELAPGGIGRVKPDIAPTELLAKAQEFYLRETGYAGGDWSYLGHTLIETGKFRGAGPDDHGLPAHMYLATGIEKKADARKPNANEVMELLEVSLDEFDGIIDSGLFVETSAHSCALLSLRRLRKFGVLL
jgi:hypothetical protein